MGAARAALSISVAGSAAIEAPLRLFVRCAPWIVAFRAEGVERLLLPQEGQLFDVDLRPGPPASLGVLEVGGRHYSAWDLGALLGLSPKTEAFVLVRSAPDEGLPPLALRTGACLSVAPLPPRSLEPLPPAFFRSRPGAVAAAFSASALQREGDGLGTMGLALELGPLWSEAEFAHAEAVVRAAGGAPA
jgi:hypothetical protein